MARWGSAYGAKDVCPRRGGALPTARRMSARGAVEMSARGAVDEC